MKEPKSEVKRINLMLAIILFIFAIMQASILFSSMTVNFLKRHSLLDDFGMSPELSITPIAMILFVSVTLVSILAIFLGRFAMKPIDSMINATKSIAKGDFDIEIADQAVGELQDLADGFNKMAKELKSIELLRSGFISDFSHEFKTPIVSISGFAELLKDKNLDEDERQEYLDIIISECRRLTNLSSNILSLSKVENTSIVTNQVQYRLDEQVRRAVLMLEPKWGVKDLGFNIELDDTNFYGNEDMMEQIFINLLDNAIKFSPKGSDIDVKLVNEYNSVTFSVRDYGEGMSKKATKRIFDSFYQEDTSHATKGHGLGLAIVKRIIELNEGSIAVNSAIGEGAEFVVTLPIPKIKI